MAMNTQQLDAKSVASMTPEALLQALNCSPQGLTQSEAAQRLAQAGPNSLPEQHASLLMRIAHYFWGPIPWMIEVAALLSALVRHWPDFIIIMLSWKPPAA